MKRWLTAVVCTLGFLTLAGCSDEHTITTTDGQNIVTQNKPQIDEDTGMIRYKDSEGRETQIPQANVTSVRER